MIPKIMAKINRSIGNVKANDKKIRWILPGTKKCPVNFPIPGTFENPELPMKML
jgi:hypothetical protein